MNSRKVMKKAILFLLAIALSGTFVEIGLANPLDPPAGVESFCQTWANNPNKSGTVVTGTGGVTCSTVVGEIEVVVQVRDSSGRATTPAITKTCRNVSSCSATASLPYVSLCRGARL